jgi:hypothetical protein
MDTERPYYRKFRPNHKLKRDYRPRYLFHLTTSEIHGDDYSVVLKPRSDEDSMNRGDGEPPNKRICVAPSIPHCCTALSFSIPSNGYSIYRTAEKVPSLHPYGVPDASITQERWLCRSTLFVYCGHIYVDDIPDWPYMLQNCGGNSQTNKDEAREYLRQAKKAYKAYVEDEGINWEG